MEKSPNLICPGLLDGRAHVPRVLLDGGFRLVGIGIGSGAVAVAVGVGVASGVSRAAGSRYLSTISLMSGRIQYSNSSTSVGMGRGLLDGPGAASYGLGGASTESENRGLF
jgi:hypothetical protein